MKLAELQCTIERYADGLRLAGATDAAQSLSLLTQFLSDHRSVDIERLLDFPPRRSGEAGPSATGPTTSSVLPHLRALEELLRAAHAVAIADNLGLLIKLLEADSGYLLGMLDFLRRALSPPPVSDEVARFVERLRAEVGSGAFEETLAELASSALKRESIVEIARAVYGGIPKSTSRKAALQMIRRPHDAYVSAKRGIDAMGGRSAA